MDVMLEACPKYLGYSVGCAACGTTGTALKQRAKRVFCLLLNKCDTQSQAGWKRATYKNGVYDCRVDVRKWWQISFVCLFVSITGILWRSAKFDWNGGDVAQ
jgi:hypothetical protein